MGRLANGTLYSPDPATVNIAVDAVSPSLTVVITTQDSGYSNTGDWATYEGGMNGSCKASFRMYEPGYRNSNSPLTRLVRGLCHMAGQCLDCSSSEEVKVLDGTTEVEDTYLDETSYPIGLLDSDANWQSVTPGPDHQRDPEGQADQRWPVRSDCRWHRHPALHPAAELHQATTSGWR